MVVRLIVQTIVWFGIMGVLMFLAAGTVAWPAAWVFLGEMAGLGLAAGLWFARHDPALLAERLRPPIQKEQKPADKVWLSSFIVLFCGWLIFMALDAVRFGWSSVPMWAQGLGALLIFLSIATGWWTMRENSFAAPVVKIQKGRGQTVVSSGPYRLVRHPMYAGAILLFVGTPLLLGSWWGLVLAPVMTALLAVRIGIEEQALRAELPGYERYAARVRYRLIPKVW